MDDIDDYIPNWLKRKLSMSLLRAIRLDRYQEEFTFWQKNWPLGLLYFQYYYYREVITDYINTHGDWGEEQIKQGRIFKTMEVKQ